MSDIPFDVSKECAQDAVLRGGVLSYPWLDRPDTKFDDDGIFRADVVLAKEDAQPFLDMANEALDNWIEKANVYVKKKTPKRVNLSVVENEDGTVTIRTKLKAKQKRKDGSVVNNKVAVVDSRKRPIPEGTRVGGGSVANVSLSLWPWYTAALGFGLQFRLKAVQVTQLQEPGFDAANAFDEVEDGYVAETEEAAEHGGDF